MKKALRKDTFKEIKISYKRFISIVIMAMLGVGFFAGIKAAAPNMRHTLDVYFDKQDVFDIKVVSTLGLTQDDINSTKKVSGVKDVYGIYEKDVILEGEDSEYVLHAMEYSPNMNKIELLDGKYPDNQTECVVEKKLIADLNLKIGDKIKIAEDGDEDTFVFKNTQLEIVRNN